MPERWGLAAMGRYVGYAWNYQIAVGDEVPRFAGGEWVLARGGLERRLFAGCVRQVPPFYSNAGRLLLRILVLRQLLNWGIYFEHRAVRAVRCAFSGSAS